MHAAKEAGDNTVVWHGRESTDERNLLPAKELPALIPGPGPLSESERSGHGPGQRCCSIPAPQWCGVPFDLEADLVTLTAVVRLTVWLRGG